MWKKYTTVKDLPDGLWDEKIARGEAALDSRLVRTAERVCPQAGFEYWLREDAGAPAALVLLMEEKGVVQTGNPETFGLHFWVDERVIGKEEFIAQVILKGNAGKSLIFRDFIGECATEWATSLMSFRFRPEPLLDLSVLTIPDYITSLEEYPSVLNSKHRYRWNHYRSALDPDRYLVETITDYEPILDKLYPLYLQVSERAVEYRSVPYPVEYFRIVKEEFGDDAVSVTIRERITGEYLGFMLLLYGRGSCVQQYTGFQKRDDLFLWHNLTIESIGDSIRRGVRRVNMGVTHAVAKRKFGAENKKVCIFSK